MTALANERVAYLNGKYLPESQVTVSFRDRGFKYGDAAFDMTRTFNHRLFFVKEHIDRLYRSLKYLRIDPGLSPKEMTAATEETFARNRHLLSPGEDFWVGQRISRGIDPVGGLFDAHEGATVVVECTPLPFKARASLYRDGISVLFPSVRRTSPDSLSPRAKTHNYLNVLMGDMEIKSQNKDAWGVLLDDNGNIAEGIGSNFFVVRDGEVLTPRARFVLPGVSRQVAVDVAGELGIKVHETDIDPYDAATADESFLTSTSLCICPVSKIAGQTVGNGKVPGPVTKRLIDGYAKRVDCDFMGQYTKHLS
jgi:branched-chain amino acid aminotransferase